MKRVVPLAITAILAAAPSAQAGTANAGVSGAPRGNPIAGLPWQPYEGTRDSLWTSFQAAAGRRRQILGKLALKPRALFIGSWVHTGDIKTAAQEIVKATQQGDLNVLTQIATFALNPWEGAWAGAGSWNVADQERWYANLAAGLGDARALVVLQIDLPFAARTASSQPEQIDTYGARVLSQHRHTTVYIDAGAYKWLSVPQQGALLIRNGIRDARGFSVNDTQYGSLSHELQYGSQLVTYLNAHGISGKHFLVNTAQNGQPYLAGQVAGNSNNTPRCASRNQALCQRTGIPPTTDVANPRWQLSRSDARIAKHEVDGYVWASQPWDVNGGGLNMGFALNLGANGEF